MTTTKRRREPAPVWREQPPCMSVIVLAGTGPTPKAAKYLRDVEEWVKDAWSQMPPGDDDQAGKAPTTGEGGAD